MIRSESSTAQQLMLQPSKTYRGILACLCYCYCILFAVGCSDPSFPALPVGSFSGKITVENGGNDSRSFNIFVQRIENEQEFLIVPFDSIWPPQIVKLEKLDNSSSKSEFAPAIINTDSKQLRLVGKLKEGSLGGKILQGELEKGTWSIKLNPELVSRYDLISQYPTLNISKVLSAKATYQSILAKQGEVRSSISKAEGREKLLEKYVADGKELRKRANSRRDDLEKKVLALKETRKEKLKQLRRHVRELEQLMRITGKGRAVDLARRVAKRENKWYLVNWQVGSDTSAIEESIAEELGVNLRKLQKNYKKAKEYEDLKMVISEEKRKIRELAREYQRRLDPPKKKKKEEKPKTKPPWWRRLDTVFG